MFTVVLSTKRISASFTKETYDYNESSEISVDYQDSPNKEVDLKSDEIKTFDEEAELKAPDNMTQFDGQQEFVPERDCKFLLYTRLNPDEPQVLSLDDVDSLKSSYFNSKLPVR